VDGSTNTVNFTLKPGGGSIQGQVVDGSGAGIPSAFVQIWEITGLGSTGTDDGAYTQINADASGNFTTTSTQDGGLPTGTVRVSATANGISGFNYSVPVTSGQVTPNVLVTINTGTGIGANITGKVTDENGNPLANAVVLTDGTGYQQTFTNGSGNYTFSHIGAGSVHLRAQIAGNPTQITSIMPLPTAEAIRLILPSSQAGVPFRGRLSMVQALGFQMPLSRSGNNWDWVFRHR